MEHPFLVGSESLHPPHPRIKNCFYFWCTREEDGGGGGGMVMVTHPRTTGRRKWHKHNKPRGFRTCSRLVFLFFFCEENKGAMKSGSVWSYLARCPCWCALCAWGARFGRRWWAGSVCGGRSRALRRPPSPAAGWTPCWKLVLMTSSQSSSSFNFRDELEECRGAVNVLWRVLFKDNKRIYTFLSVASNEMFIWAEGS